MAVRTVVQRAQFNTEKGARAHSDIFHELTHYGWMHFLALQQLRT